MKTADPLAQNSIFLWIAGGTGVLLMVPWLAMQFTSEVDWDLADFAVMGLLLFGSGSLYVLLARHLSRGKRVMTGAVIAIGFLWLWAELAVGVFTDWGS